MPAISEIELDRYLLPARGRRLPMYRFDVVVVGAGGAGGFAALAAAERGRSVALIAKASLDEANTLYAQGGVAAVLREDDSFESHIQDTLRVGCGLCEPAAVERVVRGGPEVIRAIIELGGKFDLDASGQLDLSREGGHSHPRIVHAHGAATGLEIQRPIARAVAEHPEIGCFEQTHCIDLITDDDGLAVGVICRTERGELVVFNASQVVLATGGSGQLFRETTNPEIATGDGLALAFRAGATVRDLEFVQFHPTCLYIAGAARVLISEIVRGAGGLLRDKTGARFMPDYHPNAELAPRDVVSRAAFDRMVKTGDTSVYLDLSELDRDPHQLFPGISRICSYFGIDIAKDPIPVRPGAHYQVGGIEVDLEGRTNVPGLWAVGECASTGLHGANRMGSNSLLEAMVLGKQAGERVAEEAGAIPALPDDGRATRSEPPADARLSIVDMTYSLKSLMWRQMGITRKRPLLEDALQKITFWTRAVRELARPEPRSWELLNMLTVAHLAALSALAREESRGVHYRSDCPELSDAWRVHSTLAPVREGDRIVGVRATRPPVADSVAGSVAGSVPTA